MSLTGMTPGTARCTCANGLIKAAGLSVMMMATRALRAMKPILNLAAGNVTARSADIKLLVVTCIRR